MTGQKGFSKAVLIQVLIRSKGSARFISLPTASVDRLWRLFGVTGRDYVLESLMRM